MLTRRSTLLGAFACAGCVTRNQPRDNISDEEYEVFRQQWNGYECVAGDTLNYIEVDTVPIRRFSPDQDSGRLVSEKTVASALSKKLGQIESEAINEFYAANSRSYKIDHYQFNLDCAKFVSQIEAESLSKQLIELERTYGDRRMKQIESYQKGKPIPLPPYEFFDIRLRRFSRLGFNADRTIAIGYKDYFCGGLCAEGHLYLAEKHVSGWSVTWEDMLWIS